MQLRPGDYGPASLCRGVVQVIAHDPEGARTNTTVGGDANTVIIPAGPARDLHLTIRVDDNIGGVAERAVTFTLPGCELIPGAVPNEAGDRAYLYVADLGTYDTQRVEAARRGGHLATLDAAERAFIVPSFDGMLAPWVGVWSPLRDHVFETITGEPLGEDPFCGGEPNNAGGDEYAAELWNIACLNDDGINDRKPMLIEYELPGSAADVSLPGDHDRPAVLPGGVDRTFIRLTEPHTVRISLHSRDGGCEAMDPVLRARFGGDVIAENDDFNRLCSQLTLDLEPGLYDLNVVAFRAGAALPEYRITVTYDP
ncbi:MAG: hypothetical protein KC549_04880 [Myxococcales bacterium]|nr:hypothetical protein [Myxococcales bacterium]